MTWRFSGHAPTVPAHVQLDCGKWGHVLWETSMLSSVLVLERCSEDPPPHLCKPASLPRVTRRAEKTRRNRPSRLASSSKLLRSLQYPPSNNMRCRHTHHRLSTRMVAALPLHVGCPALPAHLACSSLSTTSAPFVPAARSATASSLKTPMLPFGRPVRGRLPVLCHEVLWYPRRTPDSTFSRAAPQPLAVEWAHGGNRREAATAAAINTAIRA